MKAPKMSSNKDDKIPESRRLGFLHGIMTIIIKTPELSSIIDA